MFALSRGIQAVFSASGSRFVSIVPKPCTCRAFDNQLLTTNLVFKPNEETVQSFLKKLGPDYEKLASKFASMEELLAIDRRGLKAKEVQSVVVRKNILKYRHEYQEICAGKRGNGSAGILQ